MTMRPSLWSVCLSLLALGACRGGGGSDSTAAAAGAAECGDPDGGGGDSGDVPNILGDWTVVYGLELYDDGACAVDGLERDDLGYLNGAMRVGGRIPDRLTASFATAADVIYDGVENARGGVVFTGSRATPEGHTLYVSFGGLLYEQPQVQRDESCGCGYIGVDLDSADAAIDCWLQGDWKATKSGN